MRFVRLPRTFLVALCAMFVYANGIGGTTLAVPSVRISEIHYDNVGTDTGEAIEISAPAGTDLTGWRLVLYNGASASRLPYDTRVLSATIPATCGARGVFVQTYASNGIQNGNPDGIALIDASGSVVEFLSYGGTFTAADGPAGSMTSVDIGVTQPATPIGTSLQRNPDGSWNSATTSTFGACNDADSEPPADVASVTLSPATATIFESATQAFAAAAFDSNGQVVLDVAFTWTSSNPAVATVSASGVATAVAAGGTTITATSPNGIAAGATLTVEPAPPSGPHGARISEIHYDNDGADVGEAIEIEAAAGTNLAGWSVILYNGNGGGVYNTRMLSGFVPDSCDGRGVVSVPYPESIQNGSPDGMALVDAEGRVVEFLSYEGTFTATNGPAAGLTAIDILVSESATASASRSLQRYGNDTWSPAPSTFGQCNGAAPPVIPAIAITGRTLSDPALPVGFQDQLFATLRDEISGAAIPTTFTWSVDTPEIASIDQLGVMTAHAAGTAVLRATAADGTTSTRSLPTRIAEASTTASYIGNAMFGEPADNDPSDDYILRYPQFVASFNAARGTSNWVAYELDPTHYGSEDRCDCFTFDHALPAAFSRYTTADYTGAGAFHGYGIDRGHLARSFDRTAGSLDNARTFYFSNIVPQAGDLNQGPWANFENDLGSLAQTGGKEVYIITGVAGNKGTVKDEGKIVIPESTWKVAVIMPLNSGLADVVDYRSLDVIAVNMPNEAGVRNIPWTAYLTTVDDIEALTGYDLLALLDDRTERAVESNTQPPFAISDGPYNSLEASVVTMSASASFDPNGTVASYVWLFGDGASATGPAVTHTYTQDGTYTVTLVVTDNDGLTDTITTTANVANVVPVVAPLAGATLLPGETYTASGSFTDPGADTWSASVDYGTGWTLLALSGQTFTLSHVYPSAGTFTVTVSVSDDDATGSATTTVIVLTASDAIQQAIAALGGVNSLEVKLAGAIANIEDGDVNGALGKLHATVNELNAMVRAGSMASTDAEPIVALIARTIQSLSR